MANEGALSEELQLCRELPVRHSRNPLSEQGVRRGCRDDRWESSPLEGNPPWT